MSYMVARMQKMKSGNLELRTEKLFPEVKNSKN